MAKPTTLTFGKLLVLLGDGNSPEVFAAPCGLTTKGFDLSASSNDIQVPDCDNPDAPAWTERVVRALSGRVSGSGVMAVESFDTWKDWFISGEAANVRIKFNDAALGYYYGGFILSSLNYRGAIGDKVTVEVTMESDGQIQWHEGA
jgi:TP901-1 family phage major tail protein